MNLSNNIKLPYDANPIYDTNPTYDTKSYYNNKHYDKLYYG